MIVIGVTSPERFELIRQERATRDRLYGERSGSVTSAPASPPIAGGTGGPHPRTSSPRVRPAHLRLVERVHTPTAPGPGGEQHDLPPAA